MQMRAVAARIPRRLTHGEELLVIRRRDYERLQQHVAEVEDALAKIRRGEREHRAGKTRVIASLAALHR